MKNKDSSTQKDPNVLQEKGRFKIIDKIPESSKSFTIDYLRELNKSESQKDLRRTSWTERTSSTSTSSTISK